MYRSLQFQSKSQQICVLWILVLKATRGQLLTMEGEELRWDPVALDNFIQPSASGTKHRTQKWPHIRGQQEKGSLFINSSGTDEYLHMKIEN
jgi:hypothetical protein